MDQAARRRHNLRYLQVQVAYFSAISVVSFFAAEVEAEAEVEQVVRKEVFANLRDKEDKYDCQLVH